MKTVEETRRELFEAWQTESGRTDPIWFLGQCFENGGYVLDCIQADWLTWNAALDAVCIELPKKYGQHSIAAHANLEQFNIGVDQSRAAVESTNLGIKIAGLPV